MLLKREQKEQLVSGMVDNIKAAKTVVLVNYQGLKVKEIQVLKKTLFDAGICLQIVKNTLLRIALKKQEIEVPEGLLDQPVAAIWGLSDEVVPAKSVVSMNKELEKMEIIGGIVSNKFVDANTVKRLAALPAREEMYAKLAATLNAPMFGLVNVLQGNLRSLVYILSQYNEKRSKN